MVLSGVSTKMRINTQKGGISVKSPLFSFLTSFTLSMHALNFAWACFSWAKEFVR